MEKEFVPYEQALELKELGFDEECLAYYYNNETLYGVGVSYNRFQTLKNKEGKHPMAPTYSQAFRWFREKYQGKIWINISHQISFNEFEVNIDFAKNGFVTTEFEETFNSYEEAELACLKELIEIVKNEKI